MKLSLSLCFNGHFPGEPGLASFIEAKKKNWLTQVHEGAKGEAGINVHDVLPVTTPRGKQMMPPADRIYDPGQGAKKDLTDTGDDFLAIGFANHATKCRRSVSSQAFLAHDNNNN